MGILGETSSAIFDYSKWQELLRIHRLKYQETLPYPHIVLDGFLETWAANKALTVFPKVVDEGWIHYIHINEKNLISRYQQLKNPTIA